MNASPLRVDLDIGMLILLIAIVEIGVLLLLSFVITNKTARVVGGVLVGLGGTLALAVVGYALAAQSNADQAFMAGRHDQAEAAHQRAATDEAFQKLTQPRIRLEEEDEEAAAEIEVRRDGERLIVKNRRTGDEILLDASAPADELTRAVDTLHGRPAGAEAPETDSRGRTPDDLFYRHEEEPPREPRPEWVTNPPKRVGGVYTTVINSGDGFSLDACHDATNFRLLEIAAEYVQNNGGPVTGRPGPRASGRHGVNRSPGDFGMTTAELRELMWRDEHAETIETSIRPMKRLYTLVEITPEDGETLVESTRARAVAVRRAGNLRGVLLVCAGVLGLLGVVFGVLKLDEATRGYYTKRLFIGVPAALAALGMLIAVLESNRVTNFF